LLNVQKLGHPAEELATTKDWLNLLFATARFQNSVVRFLAAVRVQREISSVDSIEDLERLVGGHDDIMSGEDSERALLGRVN
jgi:hypothetical protein